MKKAVIGIIGIVAVVAIVVGMMMTRNKVDDGMSTKQIQKSPSSMSTEAVEPNTVIMTNIDFQQKKLSVKKGTTVTWKNQDTAKHNVVFDDASKGTVENGKLINKGETLNYTFNEVGSFPYHCQPHPFMKATIEVTE